MSHRKRPLPRWLIDSAVLPWTRPEWDVTVRPPLLRSWSRDVDKNVSVIRWLIRSVCTYTNNIPSLHNSCSLSTVFLFYWCHAFSQSASHFWHVRMPFNICYFWVFSCCSLKLTWELFWPCPRPVSSLREGCCSFSALEIFLAALLACVRPGLKKRITSRCCS